MSAKALEVAEEAWNVACIKDRSDILRLAALIDAALAPLIKEAHKHAIEAGPSCVLARELAPWEPES